MRGRLAPRAPGDSVRPRRLVDVGARPLNFTVRSPEVPLGTSALAVAVASAALVALVVAVVPGQTVQTWVRRLILVVINLSPWTVGTWRSGFTKRETVLAAWLLTFVVALLLWAFFPRQWVR